MQESRLEPVELSYRANAANIGNALPNVSSTDLAPMQLALAGLVEPNPVGMVGDLLAVPLKITTGSKFEHFLSDSLSDLLKNPPRDTQDHILPTPALYAEAIVGTCCACEDALDTNTQLDIDHKQIENEIRELEVRRLKARLDATVPILDRDGAAAPAIKVDVVSAPAATLGP